MSGRVLTIFIFLAAATPSIAADFYKTPGFSANSSFEYQLITQEYYNAVTDTSSLDPIESWTLAKDEINDVLFRTYVDYNHQTAGSTFDISSDLQVSDERFIGSLESEFRLGDFDNFVKIFGKYENKSILTDESSHDENYHYFEGYLKGGNKVGKNVSIDAKTGMEYVNFEDLPVLTDSDSGYTFTRIYNYDYFIFSTRFSGDLSLGEFTHNVYWATSYNHRFVPDSSAAEYDNLWFNCEYTTISLEGYFSIEGEFQIKDYNQPDDNNDYTDLILRSHLSKNIGTEFEASLSMTFENYWFRRIDYANQDYRLIRSQFNFTHQINTFNLGPLVRLEFKDETEFENSSESYTQWEVGITSNMLNQGSLFFDLEATYGGRDYHEDLSILTSYSFYSISLMANYMIFDGISIDMIFDGDFEDNTRVENDSNLYLLTLGLNARF